MKTVVRLFFCLTLAVLLLFTGCNGSDTPVDQTTTQVPDSSSDTTSGTAGDTADVTTREASVIEPAVADGFIGLTVGGVDIRNYTLVYCMSPYSDIDKVNYGTDEDMFRLCAEYFAQRIAAYTGVTVPVKSELEGKSPYEIVVGPTGRAGSARYETMELKDYTVAVEGGRLYIGGGYNGSHLTNYRKNVYGFAATYHAWDALEALLAQTVTGSYLALEEGMTLSGTLDGITFVGCIGDSITDGIGSDPYIAEEANFSWPAYLNRILWQDYVVINYGRGGTTMRTDGGFPYPTVEEYTALVQHQEQIDLFLIMLGTNDANYTRTFSVNDNYAYYSAYRQLLTVIRKNNEDAPICIMNCPAFYGNNTNVRHICALQTNLAKHLAQDGLPVYYFDMQTFTDRELTVSSFPDYLHPNNAGYLKIARKLAEIVPEIKEGTYQSVYLEITDDVYPNDYR